MSSSEMGAPPPRKQADPAPTGTEVRADDHANHWTLSQVLSWTVQRFGERNLSTPRVDAEHLLAFALDCARVDLYVRYDMVLGEHERGRFRELVRRRLAREPVAYIEGKRGFHALDLELAVDGRVLVPRPETELVVDWLLESIPTTADCDILDIGTGSGAIALSIKRARPDVRVFASDVSADALDVARENADKAELAVSFVRADLYDGITAPDRGWTAIISNPPYIATDVLATLEPEVRQWEPSLALDGGPDGLDVLRPLVAGARERLAPGGLLIVEIGYDQSDRVVALMEQAGLTEVQTRKDYAGHVRMVRGARG